MQRKDVNHDVDLLEEPPCNLEAPTYTGDKTMLEEDHSIISISPNLLS